MHAKLTSHSRRDSEGPPMCDYHNFLYWQQLPSPVRKLAAKNQAVSYLLHRLSFRTSAQFIRPLSAEETTMAETVRKLEADVITHCRVFIDELHSQLDVEEFSGSLFDIFDIFAAGILVLYFAETRLAGSAPRLTLIQATRSVNNCCALLIAIGDRFPQSRPYRRALSSLLDRIIDKDSHDQTVRLDFCIWRETS